MIFSGGAGASPKSLLTASLIFTKDMEPDLSTYDWS